MAVVSAHTWRVNKKNKKEPPPAVMPWAQRELADSGRCDPSHERRFAAEVVFALGAGPALGKAHFARFVENRWTATAAVLLPVTTTARQRDGKRRDRIIIIANKGRVLRSLAPWLCQHRKSACWLAGLGRWLLQHKLVRSGGGGGLTSTAHQKVSVLSGALPRPPRASSVCTVTVRHILSV
jgi:hypothetical protein